MTQMLSASAWFLRLYAGCFFSGSTLVGALVFTATVLEPQSGVLAAIAVGIAVLTASALGLVSEVNPASAFAYSALFIGIGATHTFAAPIPALMLATFGAAAASLLTAAVRNLFARVGLPSLTLPFTLVYICALSAGATLGARWAPAQHIVDTPYLAFLPWIVRLFFQSLAAMLFSPHIEVGFVVFGALCASGVLAPLLAMTAFAITWTLAVAFQLPQTIAFLALVNATFTAIALGVGMSAGLPMWQRVLRAVIAAFGCGLLTIALADRLERIALVPLALPFNLSIYLVLLIASQRTSQQSPGKGREYGHHRNATASYG